MKFLEGGIEMIGGIETQLHTSQLTHFFAWLRNGPIPIGQHVAKKKKNHPSLTVSLLV